MVIKVKNLKKDSSLKFLEVNNLINEILTFGPKMAHDDTIESLYYAQIHSFPPNMKKDKEKRTWFKPKRKKVKIKVRVESNV